MIKITRMSDGRYLFEDLQKHNTTIVSKETATEFEKEAIQKYEKAEHNARKAKVVGVVAAPVTLGKFALRSIGKISGRIAGTVKAGYREGLKQ